MESSRIRLQKNDWIRCYMKVHVHIVLTSYFNKYKLRKPVTILVDSIQSSIWQNITQHDILAFYRVRIVWMFVIQNVLNVHHYLLFSYLLDNNHPCYPHPLVLSQRISEKNSIVIAIMHVTNTQWWTLLLRNGSKMWTKISINFQISERIFDWI